MKLIVINKNDSGALKQALSVETEILLIQDGVYFLNSKAANPDLSERKIHALRMDVEKRGLADRLIEGVNLVDYDGMVDLLFSSDKVVNL